MASGQRFLYPLTPWVGWRDTLARQEKGLSYSKRKDRKIRFFFRGWCLRSVLTLVLVTIESENLSRVTDHTRVPL